MDDRIRKIEELEQLKKRLEELKWLRVGERCITHCPACGLDLRYTTYFVCNTPCCLAVNLQPYV